MNRVPYLFLEDAHPSRTVLTLRFWHPGTGEARTVTIEKRAFYRVVEAPFGQLILWSHLLLARRTLARIPGPLALR